jgi:formylglycine-generating enzyme required for sulfatase activity
MKYVSLIVALIVFLAACSSSHASFSTPTGSPPTQTLTPVPPTVPPTFPPTDTSTPTIVPTPTLKPGAQMVSPKDGMIELYVPEGEFTMGSDNGRPNEKPAHTVSLIAFWIDQTEITTAMYINCVNAKGCNYPNSPDRQNFSANWAYLLDGSYTIDYWGSPDLNNYPMISITWDEAKTYCEWAGRRLPTEAEWEKAARGTDGRLYPWGNNPPKLIVREKDGTYADPGNVSPYDVLKVVGGGQIEYLELNFNSWPQHYPHTVGYYLGGASPYGALDMAGNVWEYVSDFYDRTYYANSPDKNPTGPTSGNFHVIRGGAWNSLSAPLSDVRTTSRTEFVPSELSYSTTGFRCATSP